MRVLLKHHKDCVTGEMCHISYSITRATALIFKHIDCPTCSQQHEDCEQFCNTAILDPGCATCFFTALQILCHPFYTTRRTLALILPAYKDSVINIQQNHHITHITALLAPHHYGLV